MKNINVVLNHLVTNPLYSRLKHQKCFDLIKKSLPEPLQKGILFMYVKNDTLFFALKHPAFKMEFDYKLSLIKTLLSSLPPLQESCKNYNIKKIKTFVSKFTTQSEVKTDTIPKYKECATGLFEIKAQNDDIKEKFEIIKRQITKCLQH
ncbi:hypothetical protein [Hydrogenimonas thermophila]|uniref:DUF721 domain-containing protein n=1 Tax=Hydrogenimonas thermophila TaxID=223786 RepID=A0A1I5MBF3_9BACT|nr:hypothetical protein [Hydrogenimonas thermophila]WOE70614.1 hypothetical protein RZR91_03360 [Hydrogenimonas thermophila]WOE73132.1 hypothetical protein RZR97_03350 [Hydrogenimonas thermophila]SFP06341.1 hypothetical protein SAMN05216234_10576 [Hydrogenimonas thermophila]